MTAISRLVVILGADSAQFITELANADRRAKGFADNTVGNLKKVAASLAGLVSVGALVAFTKQAAAAADQLAETADKLGVATERLAGFQLAAKLAGISNETLEKSLGMAARRLAEFNATGEGAAGDWLKKLGLDAQELARLAPDQLFLRYADAIGDLNSRGEQLAAISALMGDRTGEMLRLVQGGAHGLDEATQKAKEYGVALTRIEHEQIDMANDAIDEAKFALQGLATQTALAMAPLVELLVSGFNESARSAGGFKTEIEGAMLAAAQAIGVASNAGIVLSNTLDEMQLQALKLRSIGMGDSVQEFMLGQAREGSFFHDQISKALEKTREGMKETDAQIAEIEGRISERMLSIISPESVEAQWQAMIAANKAAAEAAVAALDIGVGGEDMEDGGLSEKDQAALDALTARLTAEEELKLAQYEKDRELIQRGVTDKEEQMEKLMELDLEFFEWKREQALVEEEFQIEQELKREALLAKEADVRQKNNEKWLKDVAASEKYVLDMKMRTVSLTIGLLQSLAGESKAAAIAAIALEKGLAIAQVIISTNAGAAKAVAQLGVYAAPAVAAIYAQGAIQVALIAATGLVQAASVGSGGANLGSVANPVFTQPGGGTAETFTEQGGPQQPVYIVINGPWVDPNDPEAIIGRTRDAIENNDEVLFSENSRQFALIKQALGRR